MSPARIAAFKVLQRIAQGGHADDLLLRATASLDPRDAALAHEIVYGVLRFQAQLDYLIKRHAGDRKLDEEIRLALRMGIYQIRYLDRIPAHAAVTESVELVKRARLRSAAGFVNAVLRKIGKGPVKWPDRATELSMPAWLLDRWESRYGADAAEKIARAALRSPEAHFGPAVDGIEPRRQDIAAQSIVPLLLLEPGQTLLDLCAAPGNKTVQALAAGAQVIACDVSAARLAEVEGAPRVVLDAARPLPFRHKFDRILVDAPCSGTGTLGRNPEIKWRLKKSDLARHQERQKKILREAFGALSPCGRLVYATCSLEPEENEEVAKGYPVLETKLSLPGGEPGDGFYAAVITSG